jgi:hypothetical protein
MTEDKLEKIAQKAEFSGYDRSDGVKVIRELLSEIKRLKTMVPHEKSMLARLEFEYDPNDEYARQMIQDMQDGPKWKSVCWNLQEGFRRRVKHAEDDDKVAQGVDYAWDLLREEIDSQELTL